MSETPFFKMGDKIRVNKLIYQGAINMINGHIGCSYPSTSDQQIPSRSRSKISKRKTAISRQPGDPASTTTSNKTRQTWQSNEP